MPSEVDSFLKLPVNPSDICERAFELIKGRQFEEAEKLLNKNMGMVEDNVAVALFHSSLGVLYKLKGEPKTAWKHYQRAEKLIPADPALKIIMARLLIEHFAEYDAAIKRMNAIFDTVRENPVFAHQVHTTMGLAYLGKGQKKKALEMLVKSMEGDFAGFVTAQNIDFNLVEMLLRRRFAVEECKTFLEKALKFARAQKEEVWVELTERMLAAFPQGA